MNVDIVIIGAGPAGLACALSLKDSGLRIAIVEKHSAGKLAAPEYDGREIALTHLSRQILEQLCIWQRFAPAEVSLLKAAKVQDGTSPYTLDFDSQRHKLEALGFLVSNHVIRRELYKVVSALPEIEWFTEEAVTAITTNDNHATVTLSSGKTLTASLVIAADSRFSETRRMMGIPASMRDFGRTAILSRITHDVSNAHTATECFQYGGTLAILPVAEHCSSIVITVPNREARQLAALPDDAFRDEIQRRLGGKLGETALDGRRHVYPLVGVCASRFVGQRFALIGDAAVGMHPVTAHGYNLGLQGQRTLTREILKAKARGRDIGTETVLKPYQQEHRLAALPMYYGTNGIVQLFTDDTAPAKLLRQGVLRASNLLAPLKWAITRKLTETHSVGSTPRR